MNVEYKVIRFCQLDNLLDDKGAKVKRTEVEKTLDFESQVNVLSMQGFHINSTLSDGVIMVRVKEGVKNENP